MDKIKSPPETGHLLPDSRTRNPKNVIHGMFGGYGVPIFCANCGTPCGYVPEENCDFVCWFCDVCANQWGNQAGMFLMPDEVFWRKVEEAQLEKYGRVLGPHELQRLLDEVNHPLGKLFREKTSMRRK